jgi:hypothetical protein
MRTAACSTPVAGLNTRTCRATLTSRPPSGLPAETIATSQTFADAAVVEAAEAVGVVEVVVLVAAVAVVEVKEIKPMTLSP